ncbi:distal tail protein [Vibrio phage 1254]
MAANIIELPAGVEPSTMSLTFASNTKLFESTFNKSTSTAKFAGDRWKLTLNFDNLDWEIDALTAFMINLGGMSGRVRVPAFHRLGEPARGTPVVNGGGQTGGLLLTRGWKPNQLVLGIGKFFQVGDELKMVTKDIVADASGNATLEFAPWIRHQPDNNTEIITYRPSGIFRPEEDEMTMSLEPGDGSFSISLTEAFYV